MCCPFREKTMNSSTRVIRAGRAFECQNTWPAPCCGANSLAALLLKAAAQLKTQCGCCQELSGMYNTEQDLGMERNSRSLSRKRMCWYVPSARGDDAMHHAVSGRALPLARPLQPRPSPVLPAAAVPAEAVEAPKVTPCMVQQPARPQESFAANSMCAGDISTQVRTLIGEQLKVLEDRLKTEILPKAVPAGAKVPLAELPTANEKLLQQFQRLKQEGERLKSGPKQSGDEAPPLAPAEREGDPQQREAGGAVQVWMIFLGKL
eukprot:s2069_g3.t1